MSSREQFLAEIETFVATFQLSAKKFSLLAMGDGSFLLRIRKGGDVTLDTAEKVRRFMAGYRKAHPLDREVAAA